MHSPVVVDLAGVGRTDMNTTLPDAGRTKLYRDIPGTTTTPLFSDEGITRSV
ncbi:TPA: hypothetical protein SH488_000086 [Salmonella enterica]|nr:hypothetical protein [Salmonella enterica]